MYWCVWMLYIFECITFCIPMIKYIAVYAYSFKFESCLALNAQALINADSCNLMLFYIYVMRCVNVILFWFIWFLECINFYFTLLSLYPCSLHSVAFCISYLFLYILDFIYVKLHNFCIPLDSCTSFFIQCQCVMIEFWIYWEGFITNLLVML